MTEALVSLMRAQQEADPGLGKFFFALHTFADRTAERFFADAPDLPKPILGLERDRKDRKGYYIQRDGVFFYHRINLNPFSIRTGTEAAEALAHEMIHVWQAYVGRPCVRNYHNAEFHAKAAELGFHTQGKTGKHAGYFGDTWAEWMEENKDLNLDRFVLPGVDQATKRQLVKWECSKCGFNFRSRRDDVYVICMNDKCDQAMKPVSGLVSENA